MEHHLKFRLSDISEIEINNIEFLNTLLKQTGIQTTLIQKTGKAELLFSWDPQVVSRHRTRNAGAHKKELNEFMPSVADIRERIKETNAQTVANELGISRRTLFNRLKEAKERQSNTIY